MFVRSGTNTPGPSKGNLDSLGGDVTWVRDWYTSTLGGDQGGSQNYKIKKWVKTKITYQNDPTTKMNQDVLDLENWKYYQEVPIVEHKEVDEAPKQEDTEAKKELESALAINKDEGQVSGIGGLDT